MKFQPAYCTRSVVAALVAALPLASAIVGHQRRATAADFTLAASDTLGTNSFAAGTNWPGGAAPAAGNNYFTGDFVLRTPADANNYTFAGTTLTVNNTGPYSQGLLYKGTGTTGVITVNNLVVSGGRISHANGVGDLFQLAGNMNVTTTAEIYAKQGNINLLGSITGAGSITIPATDNPTDNTTRQVRFLGASTLAGDITVASGGKLREDATGSFLFNIGATGVNNKITGAGWAQYNGTFNFNLTGASTTPGASWTIANVTTQSFGTTFAVGGFTKSGDFWTNGTYLFNPLSGTLSVSAPPIAWNVNGGGNWGVAGNWLGGVAPGAGADVTFGSILTAPNAPATIALNVPASVTRITFSNTNQYKIAGPNTLTLTGLAQLSAASGAHDINAVVAGSAGLVKTGGGAVILSADNTYTGLTDVQGGELRLANAGAVDGNATVAAAATLSFNGNNLGGGYNGTFNGDIAGAGQVLLGADLTTETVTFAAAKTYSGVTTLNGGTLAISNAAALGTADGTTATRTLIDGNEAKSKLALSGNIAVGNELLIVEARELTAANSTHVSSTGNNSWAGNIKGEVGGSQYNFQSNSGTLTLSGILSAPDSGVRNFVFDGAGNFNLTGKLTDLASNADGTLPVVPANTVSSVSLVKRGAGTMTIGTASNLQDDYWLGGTTVEGGTLEVLSNGANDGELKSATIAVRAGAVLDVDHFGVYALQANQRVSGGGTILATGKTVEIYDDNQITPGDSVGTLTIAGNASFIAGGFTGALNYELGDTTAIGGTENDLVNVTGAVTTTGSPSYNLNVTPVEGALATGTYRLISHTGGATTFNVTPQVVGPTGAPLTIRQSLAVDSSTAGQVNLVVSGSRGNLVWAGTSGTAWDLNSTPNWTGTHTQYLDLDAVTFNDTAGANTTADLSSTAVTPASVTFTSATSKTFTLTGTQGVQGGTAVSLTGNATAVLANTNNNLTGAISLAAGTTLQQGDGTSTGTTASSGIVSGAGAIRVNSGILTLGGNNTFTGPATVNGGTLEINSATALGAAATGTTVNTGGTLRSNGDAFTVAEPVTLNGGAYAVGGGATAALVVSGPTTVGASGGTFQVDGTGGDDALTVTGAIGGAAAGALNANVDGGSRMTVATAITNNGPLNKNGSGVLALAAGSSVSSPTIVVNTGSLDVTALGTYSVPSGQTLSGNDGGTVTGNVAATSGSTVRVGGAGMPVVPLYQYVDATTGVGGNTTLADGSTFTPTTNPDWQLRTALGNGGTIVQGGSEDPNSAVELKTTIGGLTPGGSYQAYVNYWDATGSSWRILAGSTSGALTLYDSPADAVVGATDGIDSATLTYATAPLVVEGNRNMFGASLGTLVANGSGQIEVYVDDTGTNDGDDRTWYDGVTLSTGTTAALGETMAITGNLTLGAGSTLAIDIATTTAMDKLAVSGAFTAGGTLAVSLNAGAPAPVLGNVFDILDFASASGSFAAISLPTLSPGLAWDTSTLLTAGQLSVIAGGTPGDFNGDNKVNGADFLAWQRNPGVGSLANWKANYGVGAAAPIAAGVPEPSAAVIAGGLLTLLGVCQRRRSR